MKVSVIIPVYNVEKYLEECLESVVNQTLKDIEIIIVNDGSTDLSGHIIRRYEERHSHIKVITKKNAGLGAARNTGYKYATGEYIAFLDSDDYVDLNMYNLMYKKAKENDSDVVICGIEWVFDNKKKKNNVTIYEEKKISSYEGIKAFYNYKIQGFAWNKLYKKCIFDKYNIMYPEGVYYEDMFVSLQSIISSKTIYILENALYKYRQRDNSIVHTITIKHINDFIQQVHNCLDIISSDNLRIDKRTFEIKNYIAINKMLNRYFKYNIKLIKKYNNDYLYELESGLNIVDTITNSNILFREKIQFIMIKLNIFHLFRFY